MGKKLNKVLASSTVACLVITSTAIPAFAKTTDSISGAGRVETAVKIAEASWNNAWKGGKVAVLASSNDKNMVDALAVAPLAYKEKAPIVLTDNGDKVSVETLALLKKQGVTKVYVAAGAGVLTDKMVEELKANGITEVVRLGGADRYETAKNIAAKLDGVKEVAVINGEVGLADALSIASVAAAKNIAIALAPSKAEAPTTLDLAGKKVYAVGGNGVLADELVGKLGATRLGGDNRYETNAAVLDGMKANLDFGKVYTADGQSLIDALAGSVLAAQTNSPIVLVDTYNKKVDDKQKAVLLANKKADATVTAFGGAIASLTSDVDAVAPVVTDLRVEAATTDNLKELTVRFNSELNKDTVKGSNFEIKDKNNQTVTATATLKEDNRTVVLTVKEAPNAKDCFENQGKYTLSVKDVKSVAGKAIDKNSTEFVPFDATLPTVEGLTVTGPDSFTLTFSEPIATSAAANVEVKSGNSVVGVDKNFSRDGRTVEVKLYSKLEDGKKYDVTVKDFVDFAGYKNVVKTMDLSYVKDNTVPVASVEKVDQTFVKVKFNKPVTGLTKGHFYHTFSAWTAIGIYSDAGMTKEVNDTDSVDTVYVKFATKQDDGKFVGNPIAEGTTKLSIRSKGTSDKEIADRWGNKFAAVEFTINVTADRVAPEVTDLSVETEKSLKVKFSKAVTFSKDNVEILDKDGKVIGDAVTNVEDNKDSKEWIVTLKDETYAGKTLTVNIKNVEDKALSPNKLALYTKTLEVTDKTAPKADKVVYNATEKVLYVFFNESVDPSTALVASNYLIVNGTKYTKLTETPVFYGGDKVVKIALTTDEKTEMDKADSKFLIANIKDKSDNAIIAQEVNIVAYTANENKPAVKSIKAVAKDKTVVTFDQFLNRVDRDAFTVNGAKPANMELSTNDDGYTVVTLTTMSDNKFKADVNDAELKIDVTDTYRITNIFNLDTLDVQFTTTSAVAIQDKIAPVLVEEDGATFKDGKVKLTFEEAIKVKSVSLSSFEIEGNKVTDVVVAGDTVTLTVEKAANLKEGLKVTQKVSITDEKGNELKDLSVKIKAAK